MEIPEIGGIGQCEVALKQSEPETVIVRLTRSKVELTAKLERVEAALKFVREHPEFDQFLNVVGKALRY